MDEMLQQFENDGYVALRRFSRDREFAELLANVDRFIHDVVPMMPAEHIFFEDKADSTTLKQIQHMGDYDTWFDKLFRSGPFRQVAEQLLRGPVVPKNMQYFNKPPGIEAPTPPHQDGYYFMLDPCEAATMWFALEEVDEETGCVRYVPGSQQLGMRNHARTSTLGFSQGIAGYPSREDRQREIACPARSGDLFVHHALTIHRADGNRSETRTRRALGFIYYSERAREDARAHAEYQQSLAKELTVSGRISCCQEGYG